ncbi:unnamed protein product [Acanthoscelides obtectus]
MEYIL